MRLDRYERENLTIAVVLQLVALFALYRGFVRG